MSRLIKENSKFKIIYGKDPIEGLFIQIFSSNKEELLISYSQKRSHKLTVEGIMSIAEDYGFDLSDELIEKTIT